MTDSIPAPVAHHTMPDGRRLAYRRLAGARPMVVFLPGYRSDMNGGKANAVLKWAYGHGHACLLLDYSGCGQSDGDFADGTLSRWCEEAVALVELCGPGQVVLVGSSMGGWLMLLAAEVLGDRVSAMVGIAAAPDFTDWGRDNVAKAALAEGQVVYDANAYGPDPTPMSPTFWRDAPNSRRLNAPIAFAGPVRLIHGQADPDVPWTISLRLADALCSADVQVHLIKDGDHRLSRDGDIDVLIATLGGLMAQQQGFPE